MPRNTAGGAQRRRAVEEAGEHAAAVQPARGGRPPRGPRPAAPAVSNACLGVAVFIAAEAMFFAGLIGAFLVFRFGSATWPPVDQPRLPLALTAVNTAILLLSAYTMRRGKAAIAKGNERELGTGLLLTMLLGVAFLAVQ